MRYDAVVVGAGAAGLILSLLFNSRLAYSPILGKNLPVLLM